MNRKDIIQKFIDKYSYKSYLEIGINRGEVFKNIKIQHKVSVDPAEGIYVHARPTHKMTSDDFFNNICKEKFDIIFIDGLHIEDQVTRDIYNSINFLNNNGTTLVHDCNPVTYDAQTTPYTGQSIWNGDVWKAFVKFNYQNFNTYSSFVVEEDHGIGIIQKGQGICNYEIPSLPDFNFSWLQNNRKNCLNLLTLKEFLNKYKL
jgi:hypothetical protein